MLGTRLPWGHPGVHTFCLDQHDAELPEAKVIGQTISHYKILEKLGEGGMGVVYKAEDLTLDRHVALKFLPHELSTNEAAKTRFTREAKAASALEHPNICNIHEISETPDGRLFMVMPCYEGETLRERLERGPLEIDEALALATQVASGLARAHEKGIIHRDIKPGNVMLTDEGRHATLMDFGLAKKLDATKMTRTGMTVGTVAYMSPEQALGKETDGRTDVWSLAVMLYEMLTGRLPFRGDVEPAMIYSIINEEPELATSIRKDVPLQVETLIEKALAKDAAKRYAGMEDLLKELEEISDQLALGIKERRFVRLRRLRRKRRLIYGSAVVVSLVAAVIAIRLFYTGRPALDSIAVLPLENLSGDPDQDYLVDGITGELITGLSRVSGLKVASRAQMMQYKGKNEPLKKIARDLDVKVLMAGTLQPVGDQVKIGVELIHAETGKNLWSNIYQKSLRDIVTLINEITRTVAREARVELTPEEEGRLTRDQPVDPEAFDLYSVGKHHYYKLTKEGTEKSIEYFHRAIEADSTYAPAYAFLAEAYGWYWFLGYLPLEEAYSKGPALIEKALEIDDTCAEAHMVLAEFKYGLLWDWMGSDTEFKRSIELNPSDAEVHCEYSWFLMAMGRTEEAIAEAKHCLELSPILYPSNWTMANMYYLARRYDQALAQARRMVELEPNDPKPHSFLAFIYEMTGRYEDAIDARRQLMTLSGSPQEKMAALENAYSESGPEGYWRWRLESMKDLPDRRPYYTAQFHGQLGDKDQAFAWLEKAFEKRDGGLYLLKVDPGWDPLRDDPRYDELVRRMNFP